MGYAFASKVIKREQEMTFGTMIRTLREAKGMSVSDLGKATGTGRAYINNIEQGLIKEPGRTKLLQLAKGLEIAVEPLMSDQSPNAAGKDSKLFLAVESLGLYCREVEVPPHQHEMLSHIARTFREPRSLDGWRKLDQYLAVLQEHFGLKPRIRKEKHQLRSTSLQQTSPRARPRQVT